MVKKIKWVGTLSTTERNNIGLIQVRQNNVNSEVLGFEIVDGEGEPYDLKNHKVLFCTYFDRFAPVEQYAEVIENGKIVYTMNEHDMQKPVRINFAYFKIMDDKDNLVDTTQNFSYDIIPSIESKCMNAEPYIIRLEEVLDAFLQINTDAKKELEQIIIDFNQQIIEKQQNFDLWFESIREILESVDPGGVILNELVDFRYSKTFDKRFNRMKDRGDFWDENIKSHGLNIDWFGAKKDDESFDNSKAIQEAANYALKNNLKLFAQGTYYVSNPIILECDFDFESCKIIYSGKDTCLTIGNMTKVGRNSGIARLPELINESKDWINSEVVGVKLHNLNRWTVYVKDIRYFGAGMLLTGATLSDYSGTCYNNIYVQTILNNKINFEILATKTCWVNENLVVGGSFSHVNDFGYGLDNVRVIKIGMTEDSTYVPDNNTFVAPSLEGSVPDIPIEITGQNNVFMNARYESHEGYTYKVLFNGLKNTSMNNTLFYGYGLETIEIIEQGKTRRNVKITNSSQTIVSESPKSPSITLQNLNTADAPVDRVLSPYQKSKDEPDKFYSVERSANKTKMKNWDDPFPRMILNHFDGSILMGDGKTEPKEFLRPRNDGGVLISSFGTLSSTWENPPMKLGVYQFWVGADGHLRMKEGKPTSANDGRIVGK